jgi:hypothetical protein
MTDKNIPSLDDLLHHLQGLQEKSDTTGHQNAAAFFLDHVPKHEFLENLLLNSLDTALTTEEKAARIRALASVAGKPDIQAELFKYLNDEFQVKVAVDDVLLPYITDATVRQQLLAQNFNSEAIIALAQHTNMPAVQTDLINLLKTSGQSASKLVFDVLFPLFEQNEAVQRPLLQLLEHESEEVRLYVAKRIASVAHHKNTQAALLQYLQNERSHKFKNGRDIAFAALAPFAKTEETLKKIFRKVYYLESPENLTEDFSEEPTAIPLLLEWLKNGDRKQRLAYEAILNLDPKHLDQPYVLKTLVETSTNSNSDAREYTLKILDKLALSDNEGAAEAFGQVLLALLDDDRRYTLQMRASDVARKHAHKSQPVVDTLFGLMRNSQSVYSRKNAARVLFSPNKNNSLAKATLHKVFETEVLREALGNKNKRDLEHTLFTIMAPVTPEEKNIRLSYASPTNQAAAHLLALELYPTQELIRKISYRLLLIENFYPVYEYLAMVKNYNLGRPPNDWGVPALPPRLERDEVSKQAQDRLNYMGSTQEENLLLTLAYSQNSVDEQVAGVLMQELGIEAR